MHLTSVNVSQPKAVVHDGAVVSIGIFQEPVIGQVRVHRLGLEGDGQAAPARRSVPIRSSTTNTDCSLDSV